MLRASSIAFGYDIDIRSLADPSQPSGIPGGTALLRLVDAMLGVGDGDPAGTRQSVIDRLGPAAFMDAASVFGNFQMMNRVAEGTGIPVPRQAIDRDADLVDALGIRSFLDK